VGRNWLTSLENRKSDQTLVSSYAYGHDDAGNRTSMTEANGDVTSYGYDAIYRLVSEEKRNNQQQVIYTYAYSYDGVGNRESMTHDAAQTSYFYDNNNKLTSLTGPDGETDFRYDGNGNITVIAMGGLEPVTWEYQYDYENRLTSVTNPSYTAAYTYSAEGLRLRVQESNAQYADRWFQYDGVRPVLEGTLSGDTYTTTAKYVWEGDSYYSPLVYSLIGGAWRYHMYDGLGSTRQLMLHASPYTVTDSYSYEAFGNLTASTGTTPNPYRYVGSLGYYQTGSSFMHLGERALMLELGRFLQPDPDQSIGEADAAYGYCRSDPVASVDPAGEQDLPLDPGNWDQWILQRMFGDVSRYPEYLRKVSAAFSRCWADCMCPAAQAGEAATVGAAQQATRRAPGWWYKIRRHLRFPRKSSVYRRLGNLGKGRAAALGRAAWYLTGGQALFCYIKCANPSDPHYDDLGRDE